MRLLFTQTTNQFKLIISIACMVFMTHQIGHSQNHAFEWAYGIGGNFLAQDRASAIHTDDAGNVFITGTILGPADFEPGPGTTSVSTSFFDGYLSKMDATGNLVWATSFGGGNQDIGRDIAVDDAGNVYVIGDFYGTWVYDPGTGNVILNSNGQNDAFISKFDDSGNLLWVKSFGGTLFEYGYGIDVDAAGNLYVTGSFWQTVDFDPGTGVNNITANGNADIFLAKYTNNGDLIWVNNFGSSGSNEGKSIQLDDDGNIYLIGHYSGSTDFDPGAGIAELAGTSSQNGFVAKYDSDGNYLWAERISGVGLINGNALRLDTANNVVVTGSFQGTASFEQGASTIELVSNGNNDVFIAKYTENGNLSWANSFGNSGDDSGEGISTDVYGACYVTGQFSDTIDINPGTGIEQLNSNGGFDGFIGKFDSNGQYVWGKQVGGNSVDYGIDISVDQFNNVYITGDFSDTVDFNTETGVYEVSSNGSVDVFVLKLSCAPSYETLTISACDSYVFNGVTYTSNNNTATDTLVDVYGCDSIVTLDLTLTTIDIGTSQSTDTIFANSSSGSYQWINCADNSFINGETNASFIATQSGDYAVIISDNNCVDTSACVSVTITTVGIRSLVESAMFLYPNPVKEVCTIINFENNIDELRIFDLSGKQVDSFKPKSANINFSAYPAGIYLVQIHIDGKVRQQLVVKE